MTKYTIWYYNKKENKFESTITTENIKKAQKELNNLRKKGIEAYATYTINNKTWKVYRLI